MLKRHFLYVIVIPLCFFIHLTLIRPYRMLELMGEEPEMVALGLSGGIFCMLVLTRLGRYYAGTRVSNVLWCAGELLLISLLVSTYVGFESFLFVSVHVALVLALPCLVLNLWFSLSDSRKDNEKLMASDKMRFYDERGNLKIVLPPSSVVYIEADSNYVNIYYLEDGKILSYALRNTLKAIDELCQYHGLMQCQRSYYVNPDYVLGIGRYSRYEIFARLKVPDEREIPMTKRYLDRLVEKVY